MRLIDADAFENYIFDEWIQNEISNGDWIQFREWLNDQRTIIEFEGDINKVIVKGEEYHRIVRCRDCKHLKLTGGNESTGEGIYTCDVWERRTFNGTGFCSYAERRSDDAD